MAGGNRVPDGWQVASDQGMSYAAGGMLELLHSRPGAEDLIDNVLEEDTASGAYLCEERILDRPEAVLVGLARGNAGEGRYSSVDSQASGRSARPSEDPW